MDGYRLVLVNVNIKIFNNNVEYADSFLTNKSKNQMNAITIYVKQLFIDIDTVLFRFLKIKCLFLGL